MGFVMNKTNANIVQKLYGDEFRSCERKAIVALSTP